MLDILETALQKAKHSYRRLDGSMTIAARDRAVHDFESKAEVSTSQSIQEAV